MPIPRYLSPYPPFRSIEISLGVEHGRIILKRPLAGIENLAAALFRLDRSRGYDELQAVVDDLLAWLATPEQRSLRRAFGIWLRRVFLRRRLPGAVIQEIDDLREVKAMLAERWAQWMREREQRGLRQDRAEDQRQERLRIVRSLLEVIADDRLLAGRIGLSVEEVRGLREGSGKG